MSAPPVVFKSMSFERGAGPIADRAALGRRIAAGLVDQAVRFGLVALAVAASAVYDGPVDGRSMTVTLGGVVAVVLAPFLIEVLTGWTLGKTLLGLRVVRASDGGRPGLAPMALRTVLRAVDVLPGLYVLGILVILLTPRRQRLGDLAAGTVVVRDRR